MTSTAAASSFLSPTRASEGRDSLSANPRCTGDQTTTEGNGREAGTLKGAAQSPFYKPGERYSPPAAHRSSPRNAFPPTHSERVHGDHGAPSLPPPQGARKAAPSAGRDRRRASVRGRTARPPPTPQPLPAPRHVTESASVARQGAREPARGACAAPPLPVPSPPLPVCPRSVTEPWRCSTMRWRSKTSSTMRKRRRTATRAPAGTASSSRG